MRQNVGSMDAVVRWIIGIVLLLLLVVGRHGFVAPHGIHWIGLIGIIPILTAVFRVCPLYVILKMTTKK